MKSSDIEIHLRNLAGKAARALNQSCALMQAVREGHILYDEGRRGKWQDVHTVDLCFGRDYFARRIFWNESSDNRRRVVEKVCPPCIARWDKSEGWKVKSGSMPSSTKSTAGLQVYV